MNRQGRHAGLSSEATARGAGLWTSAPGGGLFRGTAYALRSQLESTETRGVRLAENLFAA